ncbi:UxaA family hydrolase [Endozoicomonadaceae bacterium StTr2]
MPVKTISDLPVELQGSCYVTHPKDNVAIALKPLAQGLAMNVSGKNIPLREKIPQGHKLALELIRQGEQVIRYGMPVGYASCHIETGSWVHSHNLVTGLEAHQDYHWQPGIADRLHSTQSDRYLKAYRRRSGLVGIRNELWIIPTVNCVNGCGRMMAELFLSHHKPDDIKGVHVLSHAYGCSQLGDDLQHTRTILQDMVHHPNAGGVLVLGLGCENNQLDVFRKTLGDHDERRVRFLKVQDASNEIEEGVALLEQLYRQMQDDQRQPVPVSKLKVGLECGGSDGLSGITANPLVGRFSDWLVARGGSTVLTEVPEMFGAEQLLMARAASQQVFEDIVGMINGFKDYFIQHNQPIYENPSPGNREGGITTLEEKSLGCTQKSGDAKIMDVLDYGERLRCSGLSLLSAPGNDSVATSALMAAGCHMVLFTTGRGTPYGGFIPTLKISTNTCLAARKPHWIDYDAGGLVEGTIDMDKLLAGLVDKVIAVANGEQVNNERNGYRDLAIFKTGVTL